MRLEIAFSRFINPYKEKPVLPFRQANDSHLAFDFYVVKSTLNRWYLLIEGLTAYTIADVSTALKKDFDFEIQSWLTPLGRETEEAVALGNELTELDASEVIYDPKAENTFNNFNGYGMAQILKPVGIEDDTEPEIEHPKRHVLGFD